MSSRRKILWLSADRTCLPRNIRSRNVPEGQFFDAASGFADEVEFDSFRDQIRRRHACIEPKALHNGKPSAAASSMLRLNDLSGNLEVVCMACCAHDCRLTREQRSNLKFWFLVTCWSLRQLKPLLESVKTRLLKYESALTKTHLPREGASIQQKYMSDGFWRRGDAANYCNQDLRERMMAGPKPPNPCTHDPRHDRSRLVFRQGCVF